MAFTKTFIPAVLIYYPCLGRSTAAPLLLVLSAVDFSRDCRALEVFLTNEGAINTESMEPNQPNQVKLDI